MTSPLESNQPPLDRRTRRRPGENRERLLQAGIVEFGLHGYHGASTASIGALAGVPQPHVYANFRTKHQFFLACVERTVGTLLGLSQAPDTIANLTVGQDQLTMMIFQAIAVAGEPEMNVPIRMTLQQLQQHFGEDFIPNLLRSVAQQVLDEH